MRFLVSAVALVLLLTTVAAQFESAPLRYSADNVLSLELFPTSRWSSDDCFTSNCTDDVVLNFDLYEVLEGSGECFLKENLYGRETGSLLDIEDDTMQVGLSSIFNTLFNGGNTCIEDLETAFDTVACLIANEYDTEGLEEVSVRIIEGVEGGIDALSEGCLAHPVRCGAAPRLIINFLIPSFCSSGCLENRPRTCYPGLSPNEFHWLAYRYELQQAKKRVSQLLTCAQEGQTALKASLKEDPESAPVPDHATINQVFDTVRYTTGVCLPEWEDSLLSTFLSP
ncbi:hypothetical protein QOT17_010138 [Balamuthia mandrillaris]